MGCGVLMRIFAISFVALCLYSCGMQPLLASKISQTQTGKSEADKYFTKRSKNNRSAPKGEVRGPSGVGAPRYLALQFGLFTSEDTYRWGKENKDNVGQYLVGVTYRMGEWTNSMDLALRADVVSYKMDGREPIKLSLMPIVTFPDARSGFPLYFGAGLGLGVFFKQLDNESALSFDNQLLVGTRFFNLIEGLGLIFEVGLKNQLLILSDGQHNGVYGSFGGVFVF